MIGLGCLPGTGGDSRITSRKLKVALKEAKTTRKLHAESLELDGPIPLKVQRAKNLEEIWLQNNKFTSFSYPHEVGCWEHAALIFLSDNQLEALPSSIACGWTKLEELSLSNNPRMDSIPEEGASKWKNLKQIYLDKLPLLRQLPQSCGASWSQLRVLHINGSGLEELPESVSELVNLTSVALNGCKLKVLPKGISAWVKCVKLFLHDNCLVELPEEIGGMKSLEKLYLKGNCLEFIPDSIGQLEALQEFYLTENKTLTSLPDSINKCVNLNKLYLNDCDVHELPPSLPLTLEILQLNGNSKLESLPGGLSMNKSLKFLHIKGTMIRTVPAYLLDLTELRSLDIDETALDEGSKEILVKVREQLVKPWQFTVGHQADASRS